MRSTFAENLGRNLKKIRDKRGMTQIEFARHLGIAQSSLNRFELGQQNITIKTIEQISKRLGLEPNDLLL